MVQDEVLDGVMVRLLKAFRTIKPKFVEFLDFEECYKGKPLISVRVVAEGLEHIRVPTRWKICEDLVNQGDPALGAEFSFAFEIYTPYEYEHIRIYKQKLH